MKLVPLFGRVLLERKRVEKIGNILIPDMAKERHASLKCRVLALGEHADGVVVGDIVLIGRNAGTWLDKDGNVVPKEPEEGETAYYIVQDEDILCLVKDEQDEKDQKAA